MHFVKFLFSRKKNRLDKDSEDFFNTTHLETDLKRKSIRGGAVILASQGFRFALQMISTAILARLLVPEDYGLVGMTRVIIGFIEMFREMGLSQATVQSSKITHAQVSTLFWLNTFIGASLTFLSIGLAPVVAWFYDEPRVASIMCIIGLNFLISGLSVQHQALLRRQMYFKAVAMINLISMTLGIFVGILSAYMGASYWSLVYMTLSNTISNTIGTFLMCRWCPGKPVRHSGIKNMLIFGGHLTGFQVVNYFTRNLDNILLGRVWGAQELGLYAKAYQLVLLPMQQINGPVTNVALPTLSRLQKTQESYQRYYYKAILLITTLGMPIVCFLFASAENVIYLILGEKWLDAVPIFRLLMPAAFVSTFNVASGWLYISTGRTEKQLYEGIATSLVNSIIFIVSVRWGAIGVAAAFGLSRPIILIPRIIYLCHKSPIKVSKLIQTLLLPSITSLGATVVLLLFHHVFSFEIPIIWLSIVADFILYTAVYFSIWLIMPKGKKTLGEIVSLIQHLRKK